ncbi:dienelactone hydrolase family protein [Mangrovicoccus algicola]|uniref:Dienelactone hydrolase family protein n=1 Tax=Mangrovicoccus algicola TaxID=2771008 RepID=A0A8J6Z0J9_9RHOB|nr:dienelactone hydrolase family protein [Mangrovicoccus algicola]MBE3639368.1 dienelactone hydrolase family protein [Mangrovicoccus algicola]
MRRLLMGLAAAAAAASGAGAAEYETRIVDEKNLPVFHEALKARLDYPLAYGGGDPGAWHDRALRAARALMLPYEATAPFAPEVIDEVDRGDYIARRVAFSITDESRVAAILLVPKGEGPFPSALMLHDHGARFDIGKEKWVAPWYDAALAASAEEWAEKYFSGRYPGEELARRGYVVLATDGLGWGDREGNGYEAQQALAANLMNLGSSLAGLMALEDMRAAEFLAGLPETDPERVAAVGFSMGAFRAWQVAALSPHVAAAVANCWMGTYEGLMVPGNNQLKGQSAYYMLHPGLPRLMDYPDVAALAAPKPMLVHAGAEDPLFPVASVESAFETMHAVWDAFGADAALTTRIWEDKGHTFTADMQDAAFDWLDAALR